jgi:hypothetical protein
MAEKNDGFKQNIIRQALDEQKRKSQLMEQVGYGNGSKSNDNSQDNSPFTNEEKMNGNNHNIKPTKPFTSESWNGFNPNMPVAGRRVGFINTRNNGNGHKVENKQAERRLLDPLNEVEKTDQIPKRYLCVYTGVGQDPVLAKNPDETESDKTNDVHTRLPADLPIGTWVIIERTHGTTLAVCIKGQVTISGQQEIYDSIVKMLPVGKKINYYDPDKNYTHKSSDELVFFTRFQLTNQYPEENPIKKLPKR